VHHVGRRRPDPCSDVAGVLLLVAVAQPHADGDTHPLDSDADPHRRSLLP